jgi:hypothetical protein
MLMGCLRRLFSYSFLTYITYKSTTQLHAILTSSSIISVRASVAVELNDDNGGRMPIASRAVIAYVCVGSW